MLAQVGDRLWWLRVQSPQLGGELRY